MENKAINLINFIEKNCKKCLFEYSNKDLEIQNALKDDRVKEIYLLLDNLKGYIKQ